LRLGYLPSAEKLTVVLLKARSLREVGPEGEKKIPGKQSSLTDVLYSKSKLELNRKTAEFESEFFR